MICSDGVTEKLFVATIRIELKRQFKAVFKEDAEMVAYKDELEATLNDALGHLKVFEGAKFEVSIPGYACGTVEKLIEAGELP